MANAKIISIIDHEVAAALRLTARDIEDARAQVGRNLDAVRDLTIHAIADNTLALRHDINHLAAAINQLRADVDRLKQGQQTVGGLYSVDQLKQEKPELG